jgi:hypothetical protein
LVKKLTTYQQLTQIKAWLGGCSQLWYQASLESKITFEISHDWLYQNTGLALTPFFVVQGFILLQFLGFALKVNP